jgi:glycosyltransferase involved in cell wall biosynthesis
MRIAFVTEYDASDVRRFSGIPFHMIAALERHDVDVDRITLAAPVGTLAVAAARKALHRVRGRTYIARRAPGRRRLYARQLRRALRRRRYDAVLSSGPLPLAVADPVVRTVLWTDCTAANLIGFYPQFSRLAAATIRDSHAVERSALAKCALAVYSSEWAAETALRVYGVDERKLHVVPYGANLDRELPEDALDETLRRRLDARVCRLLFNGVNWRMKGGETALETARQLNALGVPTELTLLGIDGEAVSGRDEWVRPLGLVDKRTADGRALIALEHETSHFLLLPTRIDCCPVALAEANAFALPVVTSRLSGIPTVVKDGVNGQLFAVDAAPAELADYIAAVFRNPKEYERLARSAYAEYRRRLNWDASTRRVLEMIERQLSVVDGDPDV